MVCSTIHVFSPSPSLSNLANGSVSNCPSIHSLSAGFDFALLTDGNDLYSWGYHGEFQRLGINVPTRHREAAPTLVPIPGDRRIVQCAAGGNHSLALDCDGKVYSFGADDYSQLGRQDGSPRPRPVQLEKPAVEVHAGWNFSLAVLQGCDSLMTWGSGKDGQLGHGFFLQQSRPTEVQLPGRVQAISAGYSHVAAVLNTPNNRRVVTWGTDGMSLTQQHLIRDVPRLPARNVIHVAAGKSFTLFLTDLGTVYSAGTSQEGQLGLGDRFGRNHACIIAGLLRHNIISVTAGTAFAVALSDEGKFFFWGAGSTAVRRVETGSFGIKLQIPFSSEVCLSACADIALVAGIRPDEVDACYSVVRPMRGFIQGVCEGHVLRRLRRTMVRYKCSVSTHTGLCEECTLWTYGPLLAAKFPNFANDLRISANAVLDFSAINREAAESVVSIVSCGILRPSTSIATVQEVSEFLSRSGLFSHDRMAAEFLRRRLLHVTEDDTCELWDSTDGNTEGRDEMRTRALLAQVPSSHGMEIVVEYEDGAEAFRCKLDAVVACAYFEAFRLWASQAINENGHFSCSAWKTVLSGSRISPRANEAVRIWISGNTVEVMQEEDLSSGLEVCMDVLRLARCLQARLLERVVEHKMLGMIDMSIKFSTWRTLLSFAKSSGYIRTLDKLLTLGDRLCTSVHLNGEHTRVVEMERKAERRNTSQDIEIARSARRSLSTFRRTKVYCDWLMDEAVEVENVFSACCTEDRFHGATDGRLDGGHVQRLPPVMRDRHENRPGTALRRRWRWRLLGEV